MTIWGCLLALSPRPLPLRDVSMWLMNSCGTFHNNQPSAWICNNTVAFYLRRNHIKKQKTNSGSGPDAFNHYSQLFFLSFRHERLIISAILRSSLSSENPFKAFFIGFTSFFHTCLWEVAFYHIWPVSICPVGRCKTLTHEITWEWDETPSDDFSHFPSCCTSSFFFMTRAISPAACVQMVKCECDFIFVFCLFSFIFLCGSSQTSM